ncbi:MAG: hypothetical protein EOO41_04520, partial [Methanobacteriota archaeon]
MAPNSSLLGTSRRSLPSPSMHADDNQATPSPASASALNAESDSTSQRRLRAAARADAPVAAGAQLRAMSSPLHTAAHAWSPFPRIASVSSIHLAVPSPDVTVLREVFSEFADHWLFLLYGTLSNDVSTTATEPSMWTQRTSHDGSPLPHTGPSQLRRAGEGTRSRAQDVSRLSAVFNTSLSSISTLLSTDTSPTLPDSMPRSRRHRSARVVTPRYGSDGTKARSSEAAAGSSEAALVGAAVHEPYNAAQLGPNAGFPSTLVDYIVPFTAQEAAGVAGASQWTDGLAHAGAAAAVRRASSLRHAASQYQTTRVPPASTELAANGNVTPVKRPRAQGPHAGMEDLAPALPARAGSGEAASMESGFSQPTAAISPGILRQRAALPKTFTDSPAAMLASM